MKKTISEFREFALKGNVMDLAIGVIIGSAFNAIISSLVKDIVMPLLSMIIGRINLSDLKVVVPGLLNSPSIVLAYGVFLQSVINFLVIALSLFLCIKVLNRLHRKPEEHQEKAVSVPSKSEELLTEIRDLLKKQQA